jgi:hypothetical protein
LAVSTAHEKEKGHVLDIGAESVVETVGDALWISGVGETAVALWRQRLVATNIDEGTIWSEDHAYAFGYPTIVGDDSTPGFTGVAGIAGGATRGRALRRRSNEKTA